MAAPLSIGVTRPNAVDSPLMVALGNTSLGKAMGEANIMAGSTKMCCSCRCPNPNAPAPPTASPAITVAPLRCHPAAIPRF
jgi:hypothetical protein